MRDKQQINHVKQRLKYMYTYEKGLNRGNQMKQPMKQSKKPELRFLGNGLRTQIEAYVRRQNPKYVGFDPRVHACGIHVQGCSKPQPKNKLAKKQRKNKNPNSNNQTGSKHKKNYKNNLNKHA